MRQVTRKGLITMAAAGGVLALSGGYAHADAGATGDASNSPGVLSGNSIEIPVHVPVNACGNSVSVVGLLNPAAGNACGSGSGSDREARLRADTARPPPHRAAGRRTTAPRTPSAVDLGPGTGKHRAVGSGSRNGATAEGYTQGSPGILSGNTVQAPIDIPGERLREQHHHRRTPQPGPPATAARTTRTSHHRRSRQVTPGKPTPPMGLTGFGLPSTPNAPEPQARRARTHRSGRARPARPGERGPAAGGRGHGAVPPLPHVRVTAGRTRAQAERNERAPRMRGPLRLTRWPVAGG